MSRWQLITGRYGWRTLFVLPVIAWARAGWMRSAFTFWRLKLTTLGAKGRRLQLGKDLAVTPGGILTLGDDVFIGPRCIFEIGVRPRAQVSVGAQSWLSRDCHVASLGSIQIGEQVLIGEFVSLRDSTHRYEDRDVAIKGQPDIVGHLVIESGVWIGRGCLIQGRPEGVVIGQGSIIAANSVVSRSVPPMQVWGGAPARFIKNR